MADILVNGTSLDYEEAGAGEPVVLVHGSVSDRRTWDGHLRSLGESYRVIAYSRRYHWPNAPIGEGDDYAMQSHVDDLAGLLRALDVAPAHLVGHSYGGFVCLLLAIQHPELVRSLVLAEPPVLTLFTSNPPKPQEIFGLLLSRPRTALAIIKFGATGIGPATAAFKRGDIDRGVEIFGRAVLGAETFDGLSAERMEQVRDNVIVAEFLGSGFLPLTAADVRSVRAPVLLVTGDRSPAVFARFTDGLEALFGASERAEIGGASHDMHDANRAAFDEAVLTFLGGQSGS